MANRPNITRGVITYYQVTYTYQVTGSSMMVLVNISTANMPLNGTVTGLLPFTNYTFLVAACTTVGCGDPSDQVTEMTLEDGELSIHLCSIRHLNNYTT